MKTLRIRLVALASTAILVATLAACGSTPTQQVTSASAVESTAADVDAYDKKAEAFYTSFRIQGRFLEHYKSLAEGVRAASVVVLGTVLRVEKTRVFQGEIADDRFPIIGVVIRPTRLAGMLAPEFENELTVEFEGATGQDDITDVAKMLPVGHQAVWVLRKKSDPVPGWGAPKVSPAEANYFRVVSPQGLFVQGEAAVATPLAEILPGASDMAAEGRRYSRMSELISAVRSIA